MGKIFGIISLILGLLSLILVWFLFGYIALTALPIAAIALGIVGIVKDDSKALGAIGLILGIISIIIWIALPIILLAGLFLSFF